MIFNLRRIFYEKEVNAFNYPVIILKKKGIQVGVSAFDSPHTKPTPKLRDKNCYRVRINCLGQRLKKKV